MLPDSIKDDFKAIHNEMINLVAIATEGDPDKLVEFPKEHRIDMLSKAREFRLYMLNPVNIPVMILPLISDKEMDAIMTIAFEYSSLNKDERVQGIKNLAGSMGKIAERVENGLDTLIDLFSIWIFTGSHLVYYSDVDSTTACLIALSSARLNSYDHIRDGENIIGLIDDVREELDGGL